MGAPKTGERGKRGGGGWSTDFPRLVTHLLGSLLLAALRALSFSGSLCQPAQDFLFVFIKPRREFHRSRHSVTSYPSRSSPCYQACAGTAITSLGRRSCAR